MLEFVLILCKIFVFSVVSPTPTSFFHHPKRSLNGSLLLALLGVGDLAAGFIGMPDPMLDPMPHMFMPPIMFTFMP